MTETIRDFDLHNLHQRDDHPDLRGPIRSYCPKLDRLAGYVDDIAQYMSLVGPLTAKEASTACDIPYACARRLLSISDRFVQYGWCKYWFAYTPSPPRPYPIDSNFGRFFDEYLSPTANPTAK